MCQPESGLRELLAGLTYDEFDKICKTGDMSKLEALKEEADFQEWLNSRMLDNNENKIETRCPLHHAISKTDPTCFSKVQIENSLQVIQWLLDSGVDCSFDTEDIIKTLPPYLGFEHPGIDTNPLLALTVQWDSYEAFEKLIQYDKSLIQNIEQLRELINKKKEIAEKGIQASIKEGKKDKERSLKNKIDACARMLKFLDDLS
ncbi:hypothetical protein [Endozoicomonas sp. Mp262]|uniref:hypothetical protein n=1 Tax=Endozoicomonas sp. Mp262 TaxID=2919499 RepID=UPI0021DA6D16